MDNQQGRNIMKGGRKVDLRNHIDLAVKMGAPLKTAVVVNYKMGNEPKERDLSQLKNKELRILLNEKLITEKQFAKHTK
jgi:hypothetical protein